MRAADAGSGHSDGSAAAAAPDGSTAARPAYEVVRGPGGRPGRAGAGPGTDHQAQPTTEAGREPHGSRTANPDEDAARQWVWGPPGPHENATVLVYRRI
ncbi:hypothetical protein ACWDRR_41125, partial [Kitasatospora sp. NPDC003701]